MQIAFHIGASCTDDDRLLKSLLKNNDTFLKKGIAVPGPGKYRALIHKTVKSLAGMPPPPDINELLVDAIVEQDDIKRLVMSHENFICIPNRIFDNGVFYPQAESKVATICQIFSEDEVELFFGLRHPIGFLQDTLKRSKTASLATFLHGLHPTEVRWPGVVERIRQAAPNAKLTVWCNEDTPLVWEQLIRQMAGVDHDSRIDGEMDLLTSLVTREGITNYQQRVMKSPPQTDADRQEIIADIWEEFARADQIEEDIDLAGIDQEMVDLMTENYNQDVAAIGSIPGVNLILPAI